MLLTMKQNLLRLNVNSGSSLFAASLIGVVAASCGGEPAATGPVRDIPGVVLLDNGDDGNNTPLEDPDSPAGFNSYGFWYTYDDFEACMGTEDPNPDMTTVLNPPQGSMLATTPYSTLQIAPPPEELKNAPDNTNGIRFSGSSHEYFGAGLGFKFDGAYVTGTPGIDLKAAGYTGIRFWVYSPIESNFIVKLQDAYSTPEAGLCVPRGPFPECAGEQNCENAPSTDGAQENIEVGPTWRLYEIYFTEVADDPATTAIEQGPLVRADWPGEDINGNAMKEIAPTPNRIFQLQFQTASAEMDGSFDLIIDNVGFIVANGPEDNAMGVFDPPAPAP